MNITAWIITLCVYFAIFGTFITGMIGQMPQAEMDALGIPDISIPNFIDYQQEKNVGVDFTHTNCTSSGFVVDAGYFENNATYGCGSASSGINRMFFLGTEDINHKRTTTYEVYNPNHYEYKFYILARLAPFHQIFGMDTVELQVKTTGFYLYNTAWAIPGIYTECTSMTGFDPSAYDEVTVKTEYIAETMNKQIVGFTIYNPLYASSPMVDCSISNNPSTGMTLYNGGWEVVGEDFYIINITSNVEDFSEPNPSTNVFTAITGTAEAVISFVVFILSLAFLPWGMGTEYLYINIIFFKIPLFALFILAIAWFKPIGAD